MRTHAHRLIALSFAALLATFGATAAQARLAGNGTQTHGIQVNATAGKAQNGGPRVAPQAATITLPNGPTLSLR